MKKLYILAFFASSLFYCYPAYADHPVVFGEKRTTLNAFYCLSKDDAISFANKDLKSSAAKESLAEFNKRIKPLFSSGKCFLTKITYTPNKVVLQFQSWEPATNKYKTASLLESTSENGKTIYVFTISPVPSRYNEKLETKKTALWRFFP